MLPNRECLCGFPGQRFASEGGGTDGCREAGLQQGFAIYVNVCVCVPSEDAGGPVQDVTQLGYVYLCVCQRKGCCQQANWS